MFLFSIWLSVDIIKWFFSVGRELLCCVLTPVLAVPVGILMFIPIYHPLHDIFNIHSEVTFFIMFAIFLLLVWSGDRKAKTPIQYFTHWSTYLAVLSLVVHYITFLIIPAFFNPENETVIGLREPIGPCNQYQSLTTPLGMVSYITQ